MQEAMLERTSSYSMRPNSRSWLPVGGTLSILICTKLDTRDWGVAVSTKGGGTGVGAKDIDEAAYVPNYSKLDFSSF